MSDVLTPWRELGRGAVEAVRNEDEGPVAAFRERMADLVAALERVAGEVRELDAKYRGECLAAVAALGTPEVARMTGFEVQGNVTAARAAATNAVALMANLPVIEKQLHLLAAVTAAELRAEPFIDARWRGQVRDLGLLKR